MQHQQSHDRGSSGFLDDLADDDREALLALLRRSAHRRGTVLMREGEPGNDVLVVLSGCVKLTSVSGDGREVVLGVQCAPLMLGELAALDGRPRDAGVVALEDLKVGYLSASDLRRFLAERPRAAQVLMRMLTTRLRASNRGVVGLSTDDAFGRVAKRLLELGASVGEPCADGIRIAMPITQDELAGWSGTSRQAVVRSLNHMRRLDWIATSRRTITLRDVDGLQRRGRI